MSTWAPIGQSRISCLTQLLDLVPFMLKKGKKDLSSIHDTFQRVKQGQEAMKLRGK